MTAQLHLFPSSGDERRADERALLHGTVSLHTWPPREPRVPPGAALLVLGALPKPPAEMTGAELDEFCLAFARRLSAQREAWLDALADSSAT